MNEDHQEILVAQDAILDLLILVQAGMRASFETVQAATIQLSIYQQAYADYTGTKFIPVGAETNTASGGEEG